MTEPSELEQLTAKLGDVELVLTAVSGRFRRLQWAAGLGGLVAVVGMTVMGTLVADNQNDIAANNRLWCPVLAIVGSNDPPRETDAGQEMVREIHALGSRPEYGCW